MKGTCFFLDSIINNLIPENSRKEYKLRLIQELKDYNFIKKRKKDPAHPNSVEAREGKIKIDFETFLNPEETANALITILHGFYLANTQNRVKNYIVDRLMKSF